MLVVFVIFVFLGRATDTLDSGGGAAAFAAAHLHRDGLLGYSLDNLSLMALTLAIGFLVDDAIVFLENTVRRMERGEKALEATTQQRQGNQLHDSLDDHFAGGGFHSAGVHVRAGGAHLPRVRDHHRYRDHRLGVGFADLTPLMCARLLKERGEGARKTWMERVIGGVEKRVLGVYGKSLWWFLRFRWMSALIWVVCLAGTVWLFMIVPKAFLPSGDSSFVWGVFIGREGSSPEQMRDLQDRVDEVLRQDPNCRGDVHDDGQQRIPLVEPGTASRLSQAARRSSADSRGGGRIDGQAQLRYPA